MRITPEEIMEFLNDVESGKITLQTNQDPISEWCGDVRYQASNGWEITVYNDCCEWDYIDNIETDDGRKLDMNDVWEEEDYQCVVEYDPADEVAERCYKFK